MAENHKFIQGPKKAKGTGMIYYLEKYDSNLSNIQDDQAVDPTSNAAENELHNLLE